MAPKIKSLLVLVMVIIVTSSVFSACENSNGEQKADATDKKMTTTGMTEQETDGKTADTGGALDKKITLSYWGFFCGDIEEGNYAQRLIEDALNIKLVTRKLHNRREQVDLMLATGDMPDMGWFNKAHGYTCDYMHYQQELTRLIPVELIKKYAPSFIKTYDKFPILYKYIKSKEDDNQHYALSGHDEATENLYMAVSFYRKDWLDKVGIIPDSNVEKVMDGIYAADKGFTLDQFEEILKRFTYDDPDGNGKDDTFGMVNYFKAGGIYTPMDSFFPLLGAFNIFSNFPNSFTLEDNGKAAYYYATERYKEFLKCE